MTGSAAYKRLEQVNDLEDIATDAEKPDQVRDLANTALVSIGAGAPVNPWFTEVNSVTRAAANDGAGASDEELDRLAREALERIKTPAKRRKQTGPSGTPGRTRSTRAFMHTWTDMDGWSARYDAAEIGTSLTDDEWATFERVLQESRTFHDLAQDARCEPPAPKSE